MPGQAAHLNRLLFSRIGKQAVLVHFLRSLRLILWWEVCVAFLLVALTYRMFKCQLLLLLSLWLMVVFCRGVGVGTTCAVVWRNESEDLILLKRTRPNERQYLKCNIRSSSLPPNSTWTNESTRSVGKAFLTKISTCCIKCNWIYLAALFFIGVYNFFPSM